MKLVLLFFLFYLIETSWEASWSYDDEDQWGGLCKAGRRQSPINIISNKLVVDQAQSPIKSPLKFRGYNRVLVSGRNNGHTVQWMLASDEAPTLSGGPLSEEYSFLQFHLHWISEHAIDGHKYSMEIHIVHKKTSLSREEAYAQRDGLAVLSVLVQVQEDCNKEDAMQELMQDIPYLKNTTVTPLAPREIDMTIFFSPEPQSYYTYQGSLTTPDCAESVTWLVNNKHAIISSANYKLITSVKIGSSTNFRKLQPINNRKIFARINSCADVKPNILAAISSVFFCLASSITAMFNRGISYIHRSTDKYFSRSRRLLS